MVKCTGFEKRFTFLDGIFQSYLGSLNEILFHHFRYYIDPSTIPNLKPSTAQSTSQPPVTSTTQQSSQVVHPKSIPLRTTQITLTNGSAHPSSTSSTSSSTSTLPPPSSQSSLFQADFKLAPKDPFASSNGTSVPRNSRGQQSQPQPAAQQQPSFANFDNAVFSSVQQAPPYTQMKTSSSCHLDMFSDLLMSSYKPSLHNTSSFSSNLNRWSEYFFALLVVDVVGIYFRFMCF
ncbi:putative protein TPRXL [Diaphorina citri]|uniref:Uncharacterized protein n=1 Tax=Diaphorina citri TaxID=121845 RepID=A0A3Q0JNI5_DIACI|nr:putative protein TPRXL [Diaphorina citri]